MPVHNSQQHKQYIVPQRTADSFTIAVNSILIPLFGCKAVFSVYCLGEQMQEKKSPKPRHVPGLFINRDRFSIGRAGCSMQTANGFSPSVSATSASGAPLGDNALRWAMAGLYGRSIRWNVLQSWGARRYPRIHAPNCHLPLPPAHAFPALHP